MKITKRGSSAYLYRSRWIRKGADNAHGYPMQDYLGVLPVSSTTVPQALLEKLSLDEQQQLERQVCAPARLAARTAHDEKERREHDPGWRVDEAIRLLNEAAEFSRQRKVSHRQAQKAAEALSRVQLLDPPVECAAEKRADPLQEALSAIQAAATAVRTGTYGRAPDTGVRSTRPYRLWSDIYEAVNGTTNASLLRALQDRGFAKSRRQ